MNPLFVRGIGLWTPGFASAEAWARRQSDPAVTAPAAALLPAGVRRRASLLTRAAAEAFAQAAKEGGAEIATVPSVFASAYGEIVLTIEMLAQMKTEAEGLPSPTRFSNSVHNTASGYISIASANRTSSTSLAGGPRSVAAGLVESTAWLAEAGGDLVLVAFDEPPPAPFAPALPYPALAVAFHLSSEGGPGSRARLSGLRPGVGAGEIPESFRAHPCAAALLLADAVLGRKGGTVPLSLTGSDDWLVDVEPL